MTSRAQQLEYIRIISAGNAPERLRREMLRRFAEQNDWTPSEVLIDGDLLNDSVSGHVLVDFGLETSAAITILREATFQGELSRDAIQQLLTLSYNSAVDWHIILDAENTSLLHNRLSEPLVKSVPLSQDPEAFSARGFQRYTKGRFRPQRRRVDEVILSSIDFWRKAISEELKKYDINAPLSNLFNALVCVRIIEDTDKEKDASLRSLHSKQPSATLREVFRRSFLQLGDRVPKFVKKWLPSFKEFDALSPTTVQELLKEFYHNRDIPYSYNFALLSRHALSLVYEKYVSELHAPTANDRQGQFFPLLAETTLSRASGVHYTPQYLARFMARYVIDSTPKLETMKWEFADPACGSGVFLRAIAERVLQSGQTNERDVFSRLHGRDINPAAANAALLSITLLHVAYHGVVPAEVDIKDGDGIDFLAECRPNAVIANPPFQGWKKASPEQREQISAILGSQLGADYSYAFFKQSLEMLKDDGLVVILLPHAFLISKATRALRDEVATKYSIEIIADLSLIEVFEHASAYVVLIAVRKRKPPAGAVTRVVRVRDFPGMALNAALENRDEENEYFQSFSISQSTLSQVDWRLLPPRELAAVEWLDRLPPLTDYAKPREGMVTGADSIFKVESGVVPKREHDVWRPLLTDKEMKAFRTPASTESRIFFPVTWSSNTTERWIKENYPWTWEHLKERKAELQARATTKAGTPWWRPHRVPEYLNCPKLVAPHVSRRARFSLDEKGDYIVTRAPALELEKEYARPHFKLFLLGVVNSSSFFWQLAAASHRYANGYVLLEPKQLVDVKVPRADELDSKLYGQIVDQVRTILESGLNEDYGQRLDQMVLSAYGFPEDLKKVISSGM